MPGMAAPAQTQSVFAPLISGISQAAGTLSRIDWNTGATAQDQFLGGTSFNPKAFSMNQLISTPSIPGYS